MAENCPLPIFIDKILGLRFFRKQGWEGVVGGGWNEATFTFH
jgi:hypothetical protein